MNKSSLDAMTVEEKLEVMELIWDDLCTRADGVVSPEWHGEILADRDASLARAEEKIEDWEATRTRILKDTE